MTDLIRTLRGLTAPGHPARFWIISVAYLCGYVALDWISFVHEWSAFGFTLWNPPPALSLALIVTQGPAYAALLFPAALVADYLVRGFIFGLGPAIGSAAILAVGYGMLGIALRRISKLDLEHGNVRDIGLVLVAAPAGALLLFVLHAGLFVAYGLTPLSSAPDAILASWIGDATGIVVLLPALLLLLTPGGRWRDEMHAPGFDLLVFAMGLAIAIWLVFFVERVDDFRFFYVLFIPLIWLAMRRGVAGAAVGTVLIQAAIVVFVLYLNRPVRDFAAFQAMILILGASGLLLGGVVSARHRAELRLRAQEAEAERNARITVVGVMGSALAHEISQPLASIATYARACQLLLKGTGTTADVDATLGKIVAETDRAGETLRQLRDVAASGKSSIVPTDLEKIVVKAAELIRREPAGVRVRVVVTIDAPVSIVTDPNHVEQVVINILRNAVEATAEKTPGGIVTVAVGHTGQDAVVVVSDQGPGIPQEIMERDFETFSTTKPHGMGLGLAISRSLLELHGGRMEYANLPAGGARFTIALPLERSDAHGAEAGSSHS